MLQALEEFAVEASIAKVLGSEMVDYVIDENVQIHGGNGFVHDYPAEGHYRDARVNRIFEGTNEINRLLIPGMLMKKALKGELPLMPAAKALQDEIMSPSMSAARRWRTACWRPKRAPCGAFKKVVLMVAGTAMQRYGDEARTGAGSPDLPRRHPDRHLRGGERGAARAGRRGRQAVERRAARGCGAGRASTKRPAASSWRRAARWRRWPTATCSARSWRRCAGC